MTVKIEKGMGSMEEARENEGIELQLKTEDREQENNGMGRPESNCI